MDPKQLTEYIIIPTLLSLGLYSPESHDLLLGTCQQETQCGKYIHQIKGPALGIYQCEPFTYKDVCRYIQMRHHIDQFFMRRIDEACYSDFCESGIPVDADILIGNLFYATCIARIHYLRISEAIPKNEGNRTDYIRKLATYYKKYYNTALGKAQMDDIVDNFSRVL